MSTVADLLLSPLGLFVLIFVLVAGAVVDHLERHHP